MTNVNFTYTTDKDDGLYFYDNFLDRKPLIPSSQPVGRCLRKEMHAPTNPFSRHIVSLSTFVKSDTMTSSHLQLNVQP